MPREGKKLEYAVEVPGRGYIGWNGEFVLAEPEAGASTRTEALTLLESTMKRYTRMGCPEIAKTLRIVERTITITRSDWEPIDSNG